MGKCGGDLGGIVWHDKQLARANTDDMKKYAKATCLGRATMTPNMYWQHNPPASLLARKIPIVVFPWPVLAHVAGCALRHARTSDLLRNSAHTASPASGVHQTTALAHAGIFMM